MKSTLRLALAGTAMGVVSLAMPSAAMADCTVAADAVTCGDTTTTNTTNAGATPAVDRHYPVDTTAGDFTGTVNAGATVDGFGLAFTDGVGGGNSLNVVNDGTIQVNLGNTPTAGGNAALNITAIGGTNASYSGTGNIINLGNESGLEVLVSGGGSFSGNTSGDISADNFFGARLQVADAGGIDFTSTGSVSSGFASGVSAQILNVDGLDLTLDLNDVTSPLGQFAIDASSVSTAGDVNVTTNGLVSGGSGMRVRQTSGIATGDVNVIANGVVSGENFGVIAENNGSGNLNVTTVGAVSANTAFGIDAVSSGGNTTVVTGDVTGGGSYAIRAISTGTGNVSVTTNGNISGATDGILANNAGSGSTDVTTFGNVDAAAGVAILVVSPNAAAGAVNVTTDAAGAITASDDGIEVNSSGPGQITVLNDSSITAGGQGIDVNAAGDASIDVSGAGNIAATDTGIEAEATGTGSVNIVYDGDVDTTTGLRGVAGLAQDGTVAIVTNGDVTNASDGSAAVYGETVSGDIDITVNGVASAPGLLTAGVNAISTTGNAVINVNGDVDSGVSGVTTTTGGTSQINVGAGGTVDGASEAIGIFGAGDAEINNDGSIGTLSTDLALLANGGGVITLNNNDGGVFNGTFILGAADDTVNNAGTMNVQGLLDFGAGTDTFNNAATGVINLDADTDVTTVESFTQAGTINMNGFMLTGPAAVLVNDGTINAGGDATLAGFTDLENNGSILLDGMMFTGAGVFTNNGLVTTVGDLTLVGFTTFDNAGDLDLGAGTFTVPANVFTNSGTVMAMNGVTAITGQTAFDNAGGLLDMVDGAANDELTIDSDYDGSLGATLGVDYTGTAADLLVITGNATGTTSVDVNQLGTGNIDPLGTLVVDTDTADPAAFVLGSVANANPLLDYDLVQAGDDFFLTTAANANAFLPLPAVTMARGMWYQSADEVIQQTLLPSYPDTGIGVWGQLYGRKYETGDNDGQLVAGTAYSIDNELDATRYGAQLGVDFNIGGAARLGITGGYAWANADGFQDFDAEGWNIGVYAQFGGEIGFHGELLFKHDNFEIDFDGGLFGDAETDGKSTGFDAALGYRFGEAGATIFDVFGGISHVWTSLDDVNGFGFNYDYDKITSTRGRAGVRATFGGGWKPYLEGVVYREFDGDGDVEMFDGLNFYDLNVDGRATWLRLEAGIAGEANRGFTLAGWGELGDRKGFGGRIGYRWGGAPRMAEVAPPPPPPPPPPAPAPATQTCADGSVILASEACPPPPPPPPPPPEPERG